MANISNSIISCLLVKAPNHTIKGLCETFGVQALEPYISRGITARRSLLRSKFKNHTHSYKEY